LRQRATSVESVAGKTSRATPYPPGMRTMFIVYLLVIVTGLVVYSVVGITHN
jgi:hypothetical protein